MERVCSEQGWSGRNCDLNEKRHACHVQALGREKSHKAFNNGDFDRVLDLFLSLSKAGYKRKYSAPPIQPSRAASKHFPDQRPTKYHGISAVEDHGERKRLMFRIGQMFPTDRNGNLNSYVEVVMQGMFHTTDIDSLSIADLTLLRDTLVVRKREQNKKADIRSVTQQQPQTTEIPF